MDSRDVIVVDDSPPSSPVPESISNDIDLSSTNETLSWSTFTAQFISSTMNSVVLDCDNLTNDTRYNAMNVATYNSERRAVTNNDGYLAVAKNNFPRQYRSPFAAQPDDNGYPKTQYYQNFMRSIEVTNRYSYYAAHKNNTDTDGFYYFDGPTQTPVKLVNFDRNNAAVKEYPDPTTIRAASVTKESAAPVVLQPEFVDVNAYMNYRPNHTSLTSNVRQQPSLFGPAKQRKTMSAFLNENRTVTITRMIDGEPCRNIISSIKKKVANTVAEDSDDSDIIFVGEYKTEANAAELVLPRGIKAQCDHLNKCEVKLERIDLEAAKSLPAPRRNPKRQVQCAKKSVTATASELHVTSRNKLRAKKVSNKSHTKTTTLEKHPRRSLRTRLNCGAVYCPPSPITIKHFREWPVDGMHERPEYNPVTNKIEPFDSHIRSLSEKKNPSATREASADSSSSTADVQHNEDTLAQLCHEMLHHVLAYVATVKVMQYQQDEEEVLRVTDTKMTFLTSLALEKTVSFDDRVWNVLKDTVQNINQEKPADTDSKMTGLRELIENSILLYCFTNNVSQSNVSEYIASMNPTDIIQLSNDNFGISLDPH